MKAMWDFQCPIDKLLKTSFSIIHTSPQHSVRKVFMRARSYFHAARKWNCCELHCAIGGNALKVEIFSTRCGLRAALVIDACCGEVLLGQWKPHSFYFSCGLRVIINLAKTLILCDMEYEYANQHRNKERH